MSITLHLSGPLVGGEGSISLDVDGRWTLATVTEKASKLVNVPQAGLEIWFEGTMLSDMSAVVADMGWCDEDSITLRASKRWEANAMLESLGLQNTVNDLVFKVLKFDEELPAEEEKLAIVQAYIDSNPTVVKRRLFPSEATPLLHAAAAGLTRVVELLVDNGAPINNDDARATVLPLHVACYHGHLSIAAFLIERGSTINDCFPICDTPLHQAVGQGHSEVVDLLLTHGARADILNDEAKTARDLAWSPGNDAVRAVFIKHGHTAPRGWCAIS
eukprot:TRINITY_DN22538_c0_g1_i1.p1 TRINITY_DN22538_c0_g1~~TRINITY_DN22538_c0_g1_i1.p1  ORF type:complete len:274 (+),score=56.30 TRINITY_DN22538_c0_g1_i1:104-925(+)